MPTKKACLLRSGLFGNFRDGFNSVVHADSDDSMDMSAIQNILIHDDLNGLHTIGHIQLFYLLA
jgi:hypothetical protein